MLQVQLVRFQIVLLTEQLTSFAVEVLASDGSSNECPIWTLVACSSVQDAPVLQQQQLTCTHLDAALELWAVEHVDIDFQSTVP